MTKKTFAFASLALIAAACSQNTGTDGGDAHANDARADVRDVGFADRGTTDVRTMGDGGDATTPTDGDDIVTTDDVPMGTDGTVDMDVPVGMDVPAGTDVPTTSDVPTSTDVPTTTDVPTPTDVPSGCGPAPTLTVTAPTASQVIETCSRTDMPVYFDFVVQATGSITGVQVNWVIDGAPFAAPWNLTGGPTFTAHKQVGGMPSSTTMEQPLTRAANALSGSWQFTAIGTDACGRTVMTSQPFSLQYTAARRCPNP